MDDKPQSTPNNLKYKDYYQSHTILVFLTEFKQNNFTILNRSIEHINSFKSEISTVLRI